MAFKCSNCGDSLRDETRSSGIRYMACASCGTLHNLAWLKCKEDGTPYLQPPVRLPDNVQIGRNAKGITIRVKPGRERLVRYFALVVAGVVLTGAGLKLHEWNPNGMGILLVLGGMHAVLGGIAFAMNKLMDVQNIFVDRHFVSVHHRSLFSNFKQSLWWRQVRLVAPTTHTNDSETFYGVKLISRDDGETPVVFGLPRAEQALFIAYHLDEYLARRDRKRRVSDADAARLQKAAKRRVLKAHHDESLQHTLVDRPPRPKQPQEASCNRCGAPLKDERISTAYRAAICDYCGAVSDLEDTPDATPLEPLNWPEPFRYFRGDGEIHVVRKLPATERKKEAIDPTLWLLTAASVGGIGLLAFLVLIGADAAWWAHLLLASVLLIVYGFGLVSWWSLNSYVRAWRLHVTDRKLELLERRNYLKHVGDAEAEEIESVYAHVNLNDPAEEATVVIEKQDGESLVSFGLPSPWHAHQLAHQIEELLESTQRA